MRYHILISYRNNNVITTILPMCNYYDDVSARCWRRRGAIMPYNNINIYCANYGIVLASNTTLYDSWNNNTTTDIVSLFLFSLSLFVTFAARQRFAKPTRNEAQRVTVSRVAVTTVVPYERMRFAVRAALALYTFETGRAARRLFRQLIINSLGERSTPITVSSAADFPTRRRQRWQRRCRFVVYHGKRSVTVDVSLTRALSLDRSPSCPRRSPLSPLRRNRGVPVARGRNKSTLYQNGTLTRSVA